MVARALGRLAHAAGRSPSHAGGVPRRSGLRDGWIRRQYVVLCRRFRDWPAASRITRISSSPSSPHSRRPCWSVELWRGSRRSSILRRTGWSPPGCCPMCNASGGRWTPIARGRRWSIASSSDWLSQRPQPERPFFAFLNYFDAHYPYQLLPGRLHRFGVEPTDNYQRILIQHWWELDKTTLSPEGRGVRRRRLRRLHRGSRRAAREVGRRAGPARGSGANLADHRLGPWREFRRACRRFLPRQESL